MFGRNDAWWRSAIFDPAEQRHGASPLRCLLAEDASGPRGYALYTGVDTWAGFLPENVLTVRELMAADPAASAELCTDLLSRDLTTEFRLPHRPVDDPLLYQLADPRRTRPTSPPPRPGPTTCAKDWVAPSLPLPSTRCSLSTTTGR